MKKAFVVLFFSITSSFSTICKAQYVRPGDNTAPPPPPGPQTQAPPPGFADNLSIGGSFALQFGTYTFIELEPLLNYHIGKSFIVGVGPIYQYVSVSDYGYGYNYTSSSYGARAAAMFFLPDELSRVFIMGEYDIINVPEASFYTYQINRGYLSLPMLGLGYKEPVSDKVFFCIYGLWNFNNSYYSPFTNPIINVGLDVGLWR